MKCPECGFHIDVQSDIPAGARATDPTTSKLAALRIRPRAGSQRARIMATVAERQRLGQHGMTYGEIRNATGIREPWKRISELLQGGWLEDSGETRRIADTGAEGRVYVLGPYFYTDLAERRLKGLG